MQAIGLCSHSSIESAAELLSAAYEFHPVVPLSLRGPMDDAVVCFLSNLGRKI